LKKIRFSSCFFLSRRCGAYREEWRASERAVTREL
jgi:hypothetical protein